MTITPDNGTATAKTSPETLFRLPIGATSPLWGFYAGAAMGGMTLWLMSRWARPQNLEAFFGAKTIPAAPQPEPIAASVVESVAEVVAEPIEVVSEMAAAAEPAAEAFVEAAPVVAQAPIVEPPVVEPSVVEAIIEPPVLSEPFGAESAPISPVVAAAEPMAVEPTAEVSPEPRPAPVRAKKTPPPAAD